MLFLEPKLSHFLVKTCLFHSYLDVIVLLPPFNFSHMYPFKKLSPLFKVEWGVHSYFEKPIT